MQASRGPHSARVGSGGPVSGPRHAGRGKLVGSGDPEAQIRQVFANLDRALAMPDLMIEIEAWAVCAG